MVGVVRVGQRMVRMVGGGQRLSRVGQEGWKCQTEDGSIFEQLANVTEDCSYLMEFYCYCSMIGQRPKVECKRTNVGQ